MAAIGTGLPPRTSSSERWLFGATIDLLIGCGLGYLLLVPILLGYGYATGVQAWPITVAAAIGMLIAAPHYGATVLRVYEEREERAKYRFFALYVTLGMVLLCLGAGRSVWLASALITIYVTWSPWHFAGQNYGLALMFLRRRGVEVDARTKRLFYLSFVLSAGLAMLAIHGREAQLSVAQATLDVPGAPRLITFGLPETVLRWLLPIVGVAYASCLASVAWRLRGRGTPSDQAPAWLLVGTQALWYTIPALAIGDQLLPFAAIWVSGAHSLQYLWITAYYAKRSRAQQPPGRYLLKTLVVGTAVTNAPVLLLAPDLFGTLPWDAGLAMTVFSIVNIHHFILDGAIWKLRDGAIARVLLRPSSEPELPASRSTRAFGWGGLAWGVAVLSLLVPALIVYEEMGMSRDRTPERVAQGLRHLRWVGRETVALHLEAARVSELNGRYDSAIEHYRRSIEMFPNAKAWDGLGGVYAQQQRLDLALDAYEQASALRPESPRLLFRRAQLALALAESSKRPDPDHREAIGFLRRVLELQPDHAPASLMLARIVQQDGRRDEAVEILRSAIERSGDAPSPQLRQRLAELQHTDL